MRFRIVHHTEYLYRMPASESYAELRICPQTCETQTVLSHKLEITPHASVGHYTDYLGNIVEFFSIPYRHNRLIVRASAEVETHEITPPANALGVTVAEALQIYRSQMLPLYPYLRPTDRVPLHQVLLPLRRDFIKPAQNLGEAILDLNRWVRKHFKYKPGATDVGTPLATFIRQRRGVCQDFAHLMLGILRTYGIPARYVSGYIEAYDPSTNADKLVGATASHAWVEVFLPGGFWWGLDPTNNQEAGPRHVKVAVGTDYVDAAPLKGTYKGDRGQELEVMVSVKRKKKQVTA
ncbi:MAG: transglutaminase family protein [Methylacidiphilales bacterium]|nr:transglutaminase family protein [Candidatus Methylacidiphilales bacterium]